MSAFVKIDQAASILGVKDTEARIILNFHGVEQKNGDQPISSKTGKAFGQPCRLYNQDQVESLVALKGFTRS